MFYVKCLSLFFSVISNYLRAANFVTALVAIDSNFFQKDASFKQAKVLTQSNWFLVIGAHWYLPSR